MNVTNSPPAMQKWLSRIVRFCCFYPQVLKAILKDVFGHKISLEMQKIKFNNYYQIFQKQSVGGRKIIFVESCG